MSTALQTIEPDESTLPADSHSSTRNAETSRPISGTMASSSTPGDAEAGTVLSSPARALTRRSSLSTASKVSQGYFVRCGIPDGLSREDQFLISYGSVRAPRRALRLVFVPHSRHRDVHPLRIFHG